MNICKLYLMHSQQWSFSLLGQKVKDGMHSSCRPSRFYYVILFLKWCGPQNFDGYVFYIFSGKPLTLKI